MAWTGNKVLCVLELAKTESIMMEVSDHVPHRTTYGQNNSWVVHEIPAEWLPMRWETNKLAGAIGGTVKHV
jgi:hypothetical protein